MAVAIPVTMLVAPGPLVANGTPSAVARAYPSGHVCCACFVTNKDVVELFDLP